jgi:hypothetical protein
MVASEEWPLHEYQPQHAEQRKGTFRSQDRQGRRRLPPQEGDQSGKKKPRNAHEQKNEPPRLVEAESGGERPTRQEADDQTAAGDCDARSDKGRKHERAYHVTRSFI